MKASRLAIWSVAFILVSVLLPVEALGQGRGRRRVQILSSPEGATIMIDGERMPRTTPAWVDLRPGTHQLRLELEGYAPLEDEIEVTRSWVRFNFTLTAMGRLELRAADETAQGATVAIDGEEVGTIPVSVELSPGRHRVVVTREGYHELSRWVELSGGQTYTTEVALRPVPPPQGEILVAADVSGAQILLDGTPVGTTPTIVEAEPGDHTLEIRSEGLEPHSQVVTVTAGERITVNVTLRPERPPGGTLLVLTQPSGAQVLVNGEERGTSPLTLEEIPPGTHIVEVRREGYQDGRETVEVTEGRQASVSIDLEEIPRGGGIQVTSSVPGAEVLLDGRSIGRAPLTERDIEPGDHTLLVRAPGHHDWERQVTIEEGVVLRIEATPDGYGRLTVEANVEGAQILSDGDVIGSTPLRDHELATGDHTIEIQAEGYQTFQTTITVEAGAGNTIRAQLVEAAGEPAIEPAEPAAEEPPDRSGRRYSRSGFPLPPLAFAIDAAWGWPYLVGAYRFGMGVWDGVDWARLGVGLEVRSSVWLTEIDLRFAFGFRFARVMRIGGELGLGLALGPDYGEVTDQNRAGFILTFTLTEGFVVEPVAFGLSQRLEFFVDTHGEVEEGLVRQVSARVFVGGFVEWSVTRLFHVFVLADYAPVQPQRRNLCADAWDAEAGSCTHDWMRDINLNVQAGLGLRFN